MRLVIDGRRLTARRAGPGRYWEVLLAEWARIGPPVLDTLVVLRDRGGLSRVPRGSKIRAEVLGESWWPDWIWERTALRPRLEADDLLLAGPDGIPPGWSGRTVLAIDALGLGARPGLVGGLDSPRSSVRRALARSSAILAPSRTCWRMLTRTGLATPDRIKVVAPAVDPLFRPRGPSTEEVAEARARVGLGRSPFFLVVGAASRCSISSAIRSAFQAHLARHPDHRLVVVGPAVLGSRRADAPGAILRAGQLTDAMLSGLMADALALLDPAESADFPWTMAEAMACGCPVIANDRPAAAEVGGDAPWFLDGRNPVAWAEALDVMAGDLSSRAARMSRGFHQSGRYRPSRFGEAVKGEIQAVLGLSTHPFRGPKSRLVPPSARQARREVRGVGV